MQGHPYDPPRIQDVLIYSSRFATSTASTPIIYDYMKAAGWKREGKVSVGQGQLLKVEEYCTWGCGGEERGPTWPNLGRLGSNLAVFALRAERKPNLGLTCLELVAPT